MANDEEKKGGGMSRREFVTYTAGTVAYMSLGSFNYGCNSSSEISGPTYPIAAGVPKTTLQATVKLGPIPASGGLAATQLKEISQYDHYGYGVWSLGDPLPAVKRTEIMAAGYSSPASNHPATLARFFTITDIHITDKESPAQLIYMQPANIAGNYLGSLQSPPTVLNIEAGCTSVYSPTMLYTTHVLDAAIQTVNALHKQTPIDFGLSLGDTCNSTQYNELRWYIDVLDGKTINPSSGAHLGADSIDYQKPYKAAGLDPAIPWYQTIGNHDHFWLGSVPPDAGNFRSACISDEVIALPDLLANGDNIYGNNPPLAHKYYMGVIDGSTPNGEIIKYGPVEEFSTPPKVAADPDRRSLLKTEWMHEFFTTTTMPAGHGFNLIDPNQASDFACYSFVPKAAIPLKIIMLDNTQREDDGSIAIHGHGFLDEARWTWLKAELAAGDAANQLMIIAAHVPLGVQPDHTYMEWFDHTKTPPSSIPNAVDFPGLLAELHSHPNLLMVVVGHRHLNVVKAFVSDDSSQPERGFWQVETSSLHDFPQQLRLFEINLNSDYTVSIMATCVDPAVSEGTPAAKSRKYAVAAQQIVQTNLSPNFLNDPTILPIDPNTCSYNAELFKQLGPAMKAKLQSLFP